MLVIYIYTYKQAMLDIHIYRVKDSPKVVRQKYVLHVVLLIEEVVYTLHCPIWLFCDTLNVYDLWVHKADMIVLFSPTLLYLHSRF